MAVHPVIDRTWHRVRILQVLYYYEPYVSGLTIYASRLAHGMAQRGHQMTILTSRYTRQLKKHETMADGVAIVRLPVRGKLDRAVIVPSLIPRAIRMMRDVDVVHLHLPLAEAPVIALAARLMRKRVVVTHHADLVLKASGPAKVAANVARWSGVISGKLATDFVTNTAARARVSPIAKRMRRNLRIVPPPIVVPSIPADARDAFRAEREWDHKPVIGFVGRYTSEKGIDVLLQSIPLIRMRYPTAIVALAGPNTDPRTGKRRTGPWDIWLERYDYAIDELGYISDDDLARFYAAIDVLVLPSTDWTESFGMVQIEAMMRGTPVVVTDLPGVSEPVRTTKAGRIARHSDANALAGAISEVLSVPERYRPVPTMIAERYSLAATLNAYEAIYRGDA